MFYLDTERIRLPRTNFSLLFSALLNVILTVSLVASGFIWHESCSNQTTECVCPTITGQLIETTSDIEPSILTNSSQEPSSFFPKTDGLLTSEDVGQSTSLISDATEFLTTKSLSEISEETSSNFSTHLLTTILSTKLTTDNDETTTFKTSTSQPEFTANSTTMEKKTQTSSSNFATNISSMDPKTTLISSQTSMSDGESSTSDGQSSTSDGESSTSDRQSSTTDKSSSKTTEENTISSSSGQTSCPKTECPQCPGISTILSTMILRVCDNGE
ncbi:hypothetical protein SNEBB_002139 [Seison nebaliae]|nr:hypothetical protein SNEBB_002139 [Seison nebaliae]